MAGEADSAPDWIQQAKTPDPLQPEYGLLWWLCRWGQDDLLVARGSEGHLIVVVPRHGVVIAISSANMQEVPMDDNVLFPMLADLIIPTLRR